MKATQEWRPAKKKKKPKAKVEPKPEPVSAPVSTKPDVTKQFNTRLKQVQDDNAAQTAKLMDQLKIDRKAYEDRSAAYEKSIASYQNSFNQGSSVGGQSAALTINPAQSTAAKKKRTSMGTNQFNRKLQINNVQI